MTESEYERMCSSCYGVGLRVIHSTESCYFVDDPCRDCDGKGPCKFDAVDVQCIDQAVKRGPVDLASIPLLHASRTDAVR